MIFETIQEMRDSLYVPQADEVCNLLGYHEPGDGGGSEFYWEGSSDASDNFGTIIRPVIFENKLGRWTRLFSDHLNVRWFGARGDGTSDTIAIQWALDALKDGDTLFFPATGSANKHYMIDAGLTLNKNAVTLLGEAYSSGYGLQIKGVGSNFTMLTIFAYETKIHSLTFVGDGVVTVLPNGTGIWGDQATINGILIYGYTTGDGDIKISDSSFLLLNQAIICRARNLLVKNNLISNCKKAILIYTIHFGSGQNRGYVISGNRFHSIGDTTSAACIQCADPAAFEIIISDNYYDGQSNAIFADIQSAGNINIINNFCTLCRSAFVRLTGVSNATINNNFFTVGTFQVVRSAIELVNTTLVNIENNTITGAAENGILFTNSSLNLIDSNKFIDWANEGHLTPGTYYAVNLSTDSVKNSINNNFMKITKSLISNYGYIKEGIVGTNNITFNIQRAFSDANTTSLIANVPVVTPSVILTGTKVWDMGQSGNGDFVINETGTATRFTISSGEVSFNAATLAPRLATGVPVNTLFIDASDYKLKFKDNTNTIRLLY